ncbi:MAG TPA: permease-like cell division protein FtsX [Solirubrobacteraceae bacterium]|nr:permease-like cell division protein FtsX [Solirubrobacteraceae bacterium]
MRRSRQMKSNFNVSFFLRESLRAMRRNAAPTFAALATVTVTLIVVGVFIPIVQATRGAADSVRSRVLVDVYMKENATPKDDTRVLGELQGLPDVQKVVFESKGQALAQARKQDPSAYALLSTNPLPDTFHVYPNNPSNVLTIRSAILGTGAGGSGHMLDSTIQTVSNHTEDTQKLLIVTRFVTITAALLAALLTLASVVLIGNTIRLSLFARRREIEVMKLVGATDWFIRWPFVIEGTIVGALGAVLAIVVLGITKMALLDPLASDWTLIAAPRTISFVSLVLVLVASGVVVSSLGSGLSLRRFLRV